MIMHSRFMVKTDLLPKHVIDEMKGTKQIKVIEDDHKPDQVILIGLGDYCLLWKAVAVREIIDQEKLLFNIKVYGSNKYTCWKDKNAMFSIENDKI